MTERTAVVTGAGRGIGRAIAQELAGSGWGVVVNDLGAAGDGTGADQSVAQVVVDEITAAGGKAVASTSDVSDWDQSNELIATATENFGHLDGVVNCAGILRDTIFHRMTEAEWDSVLKVNLYGAFNVSRAAAPLFRQQASGAYVHLTSTAGLIGNLAQANYSAAKLGIVGLSRSIALDLSRFNVRSNAVAPFAWSRLIGTLPDDTDEEKARVAKFRSMTPEQIAPLVAFLLGDGAADVTGQVFVVRRNEIMLMSQPRPIRTLHRSDGWDQTKLAEQLVPAMRGSFTRLERSPDVFSYDPV
jgi:NAD(P)-dependent dehydrogenase (short-subunit alcohol dehydrogenase family)